MNPHHLKTDVTDMQTDTTDQEVWGFRAAAKVAGLTLQQLNDEIDMRRVAFFEIDGRYLFVRSNLEGLAS